MDFFLFIKNGAVTNQATIPIPIIVLWIPSSIVPEKTRTDGSMVANSPISAMLINRIFIILSPDRFFSA